MDELKWKQCLKTNTADGFRQYLSERGDSIYVRPALEQLLRFSPPSLPERSAYKSALRANKRSAYSDFITSYPNSDYVYDVRQRLHELCVVKGPRTIEFSELASKYRWNKDEHWGCIGEVKANLIVNGVRWFSHPIYMGNLEFYGNTKFGKSIQLEEEAEMYYPADTSKPPL